MRYAVVVREPPRYWSFFPDVAGVFGQGATADEAVADAREALEDYLAHLLQRGESWPRPTADAIEVRYTDVAAA